MENAIATGGALVVLIVVLQPVSAAFDPVVTILERATGAIGTSQAVGSVTAQLVGGIAGAVLANLMFGEPAVSVATTVRSGPGGWLREVVATAGLVLTITALSRTGRRQHIAWAVGVYITAAYWFTNSTSFANPAVTVARIFPTHSPASTTGIRPRLPGRPNCRRRPRTRARATTSYGQAHNDGCRSPRRR